MKSNPNAHLTSRPTKGLLSAAEVLRLAREAGCVAKLDGDWVSYSPPIPPGLLLRAMDLGEEIAAILRSESK